MVVRSLGNVRSARVLLCLVGTLVLGAAVVTLAAATPTAAMRAYYDAAKKKDYAALKDLVSDEYLKEMAKAPFPLERMLRPLTENVPSTVPELRNEKVNGDRATLEVRNGETRAWETIRFVRQKGGWKLALHEMEGAR